MPSAGDSKQTPGLARRFAESVTVFIGRRKLHWGPTATGLAGLLGSVLFWRFLAFWAHWNPAVFVSLSLGSFMVGAVVGFLFTSYGEEAATVGKVRDLLVGALTGVTFLKLGSLRTFLLTFASGSDPETAGMTVAVAVIFAALGFFAMFFQRELILNVLLAQGRFRRGQVEGTNAAGLITQQLVSSLPPSVLAGIDDVDTDAATSMKPEAARLKMLLASDEVTAFLKQCEDSCELGMGLDWDVVSKAAVLHYYLTYLAPDNAIEGERQLALSWLKRALVMNPGHADLTAKYADVLAQTGGVAEAVLTLERLNVRPEAPAYVEQWLGYYLLKLGGRVKEAIQYSEDYYSRHPDDAASLSNAAKGYARLYAALDPAMKAEDLAEEQKDLRAKVIARLTEHLKKTAEADREEEKVWVSRQDDFQFLAKDAEFMALVAG